VFNKLKISVGETANKLFNVVGRSFEIKNAFITGFTGQVGSQLAEYLIKETNLDINCFMRWQEDTSNIKNLIPLINKSDRVFLHNGDLNDYSSIEKAIENCKPDFIFHLGAQSYPKTSFDSPIETLQTNIIGTANLLEIVRHIKSEKYNPVVHVCSSSEVYGRAIKKVPLTESSSLHGASPYSISKIGTDFLGQFYGEAYGIKTFVTRMGTHSGIRRSDVFFESTVAKQIALIEAGLQKPTLFVGNLESVRTFQDVRDAIVAYWMLAVESHKGNIKHGEVFNIAGDEKFKLTEVVKIMLSFSKNKNISIQVDEERLRPIDADYQMFDNSKLKSKINWKPKISAHKMFNDLIQYWRNEIASGNVPLNR
tara:strand:+ start:92 stop:1192 length:1101 start_codon:yes stop_codon:yes gene_type:complete